MKTTRTIAWSTLVLCICSCSPTVTVDPPVVQPMYGHGVTTNPKDPGTRGEVSLTLEKRAVQDPTSKDWEQISVRLANRSGKALRFRGYDETQPWYRIQRFVEGKWVDHQVGWFCGTGLRQCEIPTGKSSLIPVSVQKDLYPIRVGVTYGLGPKPPEDRTVWTTLIDAH